MATTAHRWRRGALVMCLMWAVAGAALPTSAQSIAWHGSFEAAVGAAKTSGKPLLVEVSCAGCSACKDVCDPDRDALRRSFADPRVAELSRFFECARAKAQRGATDEEPQRFGQFPIVMTPTVLLLEPDGRLELTRLGGPASANALAASMQGLAEFAPAKRTLLSNPEDRAALAAVGHVYTRLEKYDRGLPHLRKALAGDQAFARREDAELDAAICELLAEEQPPRASGQAPQWLRSLEGFVAAHTQSPRHAEALFYLSTAYLQVGESQAAERCLEQLIAQKPGDSRWRQLAEQTLPRLQVPRLRAQAMQRPDDPVANYQLGRVLLLVGEFDDAFKCLTRALQLDPEDKSGVKADATLELALYWYWLDARVGGLRLMDFLRKYPDSKRVPEALYYLATWAYSREALEEARDAAQRLVQQAPNSPWAKQAQDLLQRIEARSPAAG